MSGPGRSGFYPLAWLFYLALAIAGVVWLGFQRGRIGAELFVSPDQPWIDLAAGVATGAALLGVWEALRRGSHAARALEAELGKLVAPLSRSEALALAAISAIGEELFFRGALQGALGLLPAAALFALLHAGPAKPFRVWGLFALLAGLGLGALVVWRGALGGAIVAHALVNGVNLVRLSRAGTWKDGVGGRP
jgi:membrane protease YdiL (CAAX protease family)